MSSHRTSPRRAPSFSSRPGFPSGLRVLLLESGLNSADAQLRALSFAPTRVTTAAAALAAVDKAQLEQPFDVLLGDAGLLMEDSGPGRELRERLLPRLPTIMMAGDEDVHDGAQQVIMAGIKLGVVEVLQRPLCPLKLKNIWQHTVRHMMRRRHSPSHGPSPRKSQDSLNGSSQPTDSSPPHGAAGGASDDTAWPADQQQPRERQARESMDMERPHARRVTVVRRKAAGGPDTSAGDEAGPAIVAEAAPKGGEDVCGLPPQGAAPVTPPAWTLGAPLGALPPTPAGASAAGLLPQGMAWGMPMNPHALAPGITPPIFPTPAAVPPALMMLAAHPTWPTAAPPLAPLAPLPYNPASNGMFSPALTASTAAIPPLPLPLLMGACGGAMGGPYGCMDGGMFGSFPCTVAAAATPCSPGPATTHSMASPSDQSAQDALTLGCDFMAAAYPMHGCSTQTAITNKISRVESNQLLPSLEDLIADTPDTVDCLELDALSLGCLGLPRPGSLDDLLSHTVAAF